MAKGRDSKGRFLKRGGGGGTALARRSSGSISRRAPRGGIITVRENITVRGPSRRPRGRLRRVARGVVDNGMAIGVTLGSAGYGYLCHSPQTASLMAKIPTVGAIGAHLSRGIAIYMLNKHTIRNKYVDQVALGALAIGGYSFGVGAAKAGGFSPAVLGGAIGDGDDLLGDDDLGDDFEE